ncbi:hypothetical protein J6590_062179 [Homalodisca vitripennis]|nr:hypothetical protein J6590_062179 [Homalodisca vitripennis]
MKVINHFFKIIEQNVSIIKFPRLSHHCAVHDTEARPHQLFDDEFIKPPDIPSIQSRDLAHERVSFRPGAVKYLCLTTSSYSRLIYRAFSHVIWLTSVCHSDPGDDVHIDELCCVAYCYRKHSEIFVFDDELIKPPDIPSIQSRDLAHERVSCRPVMMHAVKYLCLTTSSKPPDIPSIQSRDLAHERVIPTRAVKYLCLTTSSYSRLIYRAFSHVIWLTSVCHSDPGDDVHIDELCCVAYCYRKYSEIFVFDDELIKPPDIPSIQSRDLAHERVSCRPGDYVHIDVLCCVAYCCRQRSEIFVFDDEFIKPPDIPSIQSRDLAHERVSFRPGAVKYLCLTTSSYSRLIYRAFSHVIWLTSVCHSDPGDDVHIDVLCCVAYCYRKHSEIFVFDDELIKPPDIPSIQSRDLAHERVSCRPGDDVHIDVLCCVAYCCRQRSEIFVFDDEFIKPPDIPSIHVCHSDPGDDVHIDVLCCVAYCYRKHSEIFVFDDELIKPPDIPSIHVCHSDPGDDVHIDVLCYVAYCYRKHSETFVFDDELIKPPDIPSIQSRDLAHERMSCRPG